jgi:hypothetical protein
MKPFSFVIWCLWAAVLVRVLVTPFWTLTPGQGAILLLVAAPAIGVLSWIGSLLRHASRNGPLSSARF